MIDQNRIRDWTNLQFFLAVAQTGSFFAAAKLLKTNQSTVARRIYRLESDLGTKLFDRHAHGMVLTESGALALHKIGHIGEAVTEVEKTLTGLQTTERGVVTISVLDGTGAMWLLSTLPDFYQRFPEIVIRINANQKSLNLLAHDADISIQGDRPQALRLVAFKAGRIAHKMYVSQAYVARKGMPATMADMKDHEVIDHEPYRAEAYRLWWVDQVLATARVSLICNSANIMLSAARRGIGIALLPVFYDHTAPDLIPLPIPVPSVSQLWVVTHEETNKSRRVQAVVGFLRERFRKDRGLWFPAAS